MSFFNLFFPKKMVGVDVGTSSIKVVEISRLRQGKTLENYAQITSEHLYKDPGVAQEKGNTLLAKEFVARAVKAMLQEAKIKTKAAVLSIPDFATFCTSFEIPPMPEKEIPGAVRYNASQYITLPISEVTLDWKIISNPKDKNALLKVFLAAVPNQVVQEYQWIAKEAGLDLHALEAEALGIARSAIKSGKKLVCLLDIGVQSSTVNQVENGFLRRSYSFNFNSNQLIKALISALRLDAAQASKIVNTEGLLSAKPGVSQTLYPLVDPLLLEVKNISAEFYQQEQKTVEEIYITGGMANLPGLKEYFSESLKKNVYVPNCFSEFFYPPILESTLKEMSPSFSAAVGVAVGGLTLR